MLCEFFVAFAQYGAAADSQAIMHLCSFVPGQLHTYSARNVMMSSAVTLLLASILSRRVLGRRE